MAEDVAPGIDVRAIQRCHADGFRTEFPKSDPTVEDRSVFVDLSAAMADGVVATAANWRADLILYTPEAVAALIASARWSIPAVFCGVGIAHTPEFMRFRYATAAPAAARHGVLVLEPADTWIDMIPPSLRRQPSRGRPMRYVQYNGGGPGPREAKGGRARVAVTLGTVVPVVFGLGLFRRIIDAAADVDATFLLACGPGDTRELGILPPNVEVSSWIGLDGLLPVCDGIVHHGGFGTALAALAAGVPQLLVPQGADQFYNSAVLTWRGVASSCRPDEVHSDLLRALPADEALTENARGVAAEIEDMPAPRDIVPDLAALAN
jgi:UDP:flavonoid glycosyltransferase YjiC (YdhE family)